MIDTHPYLEIKNIALSSWFKQAEILESTKMLSYVLSNWLELTMLAQLLSSVYFFELCTVVYVVEQIESGYMLPSWKHISNLEAYLYCSRSSKILKSQPDYDCTVHAGAGN